MWPAFWDQNFVCQCALKLESGKMGSVGADSESNSKFWSLWHGAK